MDKADSDLKLAKQSITETPTEENRLLRVQVQKLQDLNDTMRDNKHKVAIEEETERQLQTKMWEIEDGESARLANNKTKASEDKRQENAVEYHNIASESTNRVEQSKYTDEQVSLILQAYEAKMKQLVITHVCLQPSIAVRHIDRAQLERVQKTMAVPRVGGAEKLETPEISRDELENVFGDLSRDMAPDAVMQMAAAGRNDHNTHTRPRYSSHSTPLRVSDEGDDCDELGDIPLSAFSVIHKRTNDDGDDEPPDHNDGGNAGNSNRRDREDGEKDERGEFQLVNSRNVEIVRFHGAMGCKITYI